MWAGVDSAWEQEKPEARKMLENAADSHTSGARFVGQILQDDFELGFAKQTFIIHYWYGLWLAKSTCQSGIYIMNQMPNRTIHQKFSARRASSFFCSDDDRSLERGACRKGSGRVHNAGRVRRNPAPLPCWMQ